MNLFDANTPFPPKPDLLIYLDLLLGVLSASRAKSSSSWKRFIVPLTRQPKSARSLKLKRLGIVTSRSRDSRVRNIFLSFLGDTVRLLTLKFSDPQPEHAVIMSKFAMECMLKMNDLTQKLEVTLGPDTVGICVLVCFVPRFCQAYQFVLVDHRGI